MQESVSGLPRNSCPESSGIIVRFTQESLSAIRRKCCPVWARICTLTSNAEWRARLDGLFDEIQSFTKIKFSDLEVYVYSENAASCSIGFEWSFINTAGETISSHGSWLYVFTIFDEEWRVVHSGGTHIYS